VATQQATNVLTVPSAALRGAAGNYSVQVVDEAGGVTTVAVTVGLIASGSAEIQNGLAEGERVVIGTTAARQGTTTTGGAGTVIGLPGGLGGGGFGGAGTGGGGTRAGNGGRTTTP
jgi:hypothetical protein